MLSSIEKLLEQKNPFDLSVDSVLAISKTYKYFNVIHREHYSDPDDYYVVGYRNLFFRAIGWKDSLLVSSLPDNAWYMVSVFRTVRDYCKFNKLIKEVGIS